MKTSSFLLRFAGGAVLALTAGASVIAAADSPSQPDPPVPAEVVMQHPLAVATTAGEREPDCRCAVLHARDIESRIDGHVARWQSMPRTAEDAERERVATRVVPLRLTAFVEGVVGFPVRHYRLALDDSAYGEH
jgi:hypothetical protein